MLNLKYIILLALLCSCLATSDVDKHTVLDKLQSYIDNSKFDGSTFMEIQDLVSTSVDKYLQATNETNATATTTTTTSTVETKQKGKTRFTADTFANNLLITSGCSGDTIEADASVEVTNMLNTTFFNTDNLNLQELYLTSLYNPHNPIVMRGNFKMKTIKTSQPVQATSFMVQDVQQWTLLKHESFHEDEKIEGWSLTQISSCEGSQLKDKFLGGPCVLNTDVTKKIENLPSHKKLRIKATVHLFDNWEGENIFLQTDGGKTVWSQKGTVNKKFETPNRCGNPEYGDPLMNLNIDKIIDHEESFLSLRFSTNMNKDVCKASYAIEDFSLYFQ